MPTPHHDDIKEVLTPLENYWGSIHDWQAAGYGPTFAKHRDSDELGESNYETILTAFNQNFEYGRDFVVEGSSHWAVGWMDQIVVRVLDCMCNDDVIQDRVIKHNAAQQDYVCLTCDSLCKVSAIFVECLEYKARLDDYPVLDEEDFSRREYENMIEWLEQEVGEEHAGDLYTHLYEVHSACRPDDVKYEWITEWKEANLALDSDD